MSRYGDQYYNVDLRREVAPADWDTLDLWFGMHMVVSPGTEETVNLDEYLEAFGWRVAERYHVELRERVATAERVGRPDEDDLMSLSDAALHYRHLLLVRLTHRWLAKD